MTRAHDERLALNDFAGGGVTPFSYADGSCGIRGVSGATALPSAITLAATFDTALAEEYGQLLGGELIAAGHNILLAPALDIARDPRSGRIGENLGEDPLLAGELGGSMGRGIQSRGALAIAKHFVGNNVERLRTGEGAFGSRTDAVDVCIDERPLHEVYMAPFRRAVRKYGVAGLLGSYNRLNGVYACQSPDLLQLPRTEWGFEGVTVPDFLFGVRDAEAALHAGLDIAGLEELAGRTPEMVAAADDELLSALGDHVRAAAAAVGLVAATGEIDPSGLATAAALALAERVAIDGSVLLRNTGALPLPEGARVALVGIEDVRHRLVVGGAASVTLTDDRLPDLVDALAHDGIEVTASASGFANVPQPALRVEDGFALSAVVRDADGEHAVPLETAELRADPARPDAEWAAELTVTLPASSDSLVVTAEFAGELELLLDGAPIAAGFREASPMIAGPTYVLQTLVPTGDGRERTLLARYRSGAAIAVPGTPIMPHLVLGAAPLAPGVDAAVAAASGVDAVLVLAGRVTGEAMDADDLALPAGQAEIIDALVATGVPVIVITHGGGPVLMPWRERVAAILHVGHSGERFAPALAAMLSGRAEPGGRLPLTVPADEVPVAPIDPGIDRVEYAEGVDVGYRGYERGDIPPAYWFGHGLGYSRIELVGATADGGDVVARVRCGTERGGKAVLQLYARGAESDTLRLVGFAVVRLEPGEEREVRVGVDREALERRVDGRWVAHTGPISVSVGFSRGDLRATVEADLT
ncbi:glycoside hydrolase family 3 protein [Microbacterium sp. CFBP9034]|uniref:glycoside hydrolase family 3 protein n=1 Tax=Microbacterium sp. CFBP9034 TaxID=3096540 RepID=UPI002A69BA9C|nr:glycoside hydrolase family 3 C-terminal domain-containing protein [Microbacterium sp. CFBP9034]MDY0908816.1 glycoside hydrolase family 3 C-terminal domain-containing protein [Microbacterium sp. CFBP9034]